MHHISWAQGNEKQKGSFGFKFQLLELTITLILLVPKRSSHQSIIVIVEIS